MNCAQVKKSLQYDHLPLTILQQSELEAHAQSCEACHKELAIDRLMSMLVNSQIDPMVEESPWDEVQLANRIKARINEMNERGMGSWETAVIAVRGWLLAFGAAAILLVMLSNQLTTNSLAELPDQSERDQASLNSPLMNEDILSNNTASPKVFVEELEHAH
ncbi:MAG TPA: hypothetical protein PLD20_25445 [Blastocatellia bacterium]|nr:hypothetical protein [Blastocatellia bacterium]HMV84409.1 hypothetical protein [Blastocatellia bacterium]HMZ21304.1 hypothetical protein [Blastocatellia bacterium]